MESVTVALTRFNEPNDMLRTCLQAISEQRAVKARVVLLDQQRCEATKGYCRDISSDRVTFEYHNISVKGCAQARNRAVNLCETDILLWTDPDIVHAPDWAAELSRVLTGDQSDVVGGKIIPMWHTRPRWYMTSNVMADHYSLIDLGEDTRSADRVIGGSLGMHLRRLGQEGRFDERLGRQEGTLLGGIDAEFCERVRAGGFRVHYVGAAVVRHQIPVERTRLKWIARKIYYGGLSRGLRGGKPRSMNQNRRITDYILMGMFTPLYLTGLVYSRRFKHLRSRPMVKQGEMNQV